MSTTAARVSSIPARLTLETFSLNRIMAETVTISLYVNGTQVTNSERTLYIGRNTTGTVTTQAILTGVTAGQAVEGRWRMGIGNSMTLQIRSLILIDVN